MLLNRPPGPRTHLKLSLLSAVTDGCQGILYRRVGGRYEMSWLVDGVIYPGNVPYRGYVRKYGAILWEYAHGQAGLVGRVARFFRRLGLVSERGAFDMAVGPEYVVGITYRVEWHRGRITELVIDLGECAAALSASGIAKWEYDMAWYGPLDS